MAIIKVLVVDDNEGDLLVFEEAIEEIQSYLKNKEIDISFEIEKAKNGSIALEKIDIDIFDIIFLDIKMPVMNGIECLRNIKEKNIKSYIVMFTTSDYDEDIKAVEELGADGYLLKSLDLYEFEENLKTSLMLFFQDNFIYFLKTLKKR